MARGADVNGISGPSFMGSVRMRDGRESMLSALRRLRRWVAPPVPAQVWLELLACSLNGVFASLGQSLNSLALGWHSLLERHG
jgi:hypothetical protein